MFLSLTLTLLLLHHNDYRVREAAFASLCSEPAQVLLLYYDLVDPVQRRYIRLALTNKTKPKVSPGVPYDMVNWKRFQRYGVFDTITPQGVFSLIDDGLADARLWSRYFATTYYLVWHLKMHDVPDDEIEAELLRAHLAWYAYVTDRYWLAVARECLFPDMPWWSVYDPPFRTSLILFGFAPLGW